MGTGFERIREICRKENAPLPGIEFDDRHFYVTFRPSREYLRLAGSRGTTQKTTQKILSLLAGSPEMTRRDIAESLGITQDGVKYHLAAMKKKGLLRRVGGRKGGRWEVSGG